MTKKTTYIYFYIGFILTTFASVASPGSNVPQLANQTSFPFDALTESIASDFAQDIATSPPKSFTEILKTTRDFAKLECTCKDNYARFKEKKQKMLRAIPAKTIQACVRHLGTLKGDEHRLELKKFLDFLERSELYFKDYYSEDPTRAQMIQGKLNGRLQDAIKARNFDKIRRYFNAGAKLTTYKLPFKPYKETTFEILTTHPSYKPIVEELLRYAVTNQNTHTHFLSQALLLAAKCNYTEYVKNILEKDTGATITANTKGTALTLTLNSEIIATLLAQGADINFTDANQMTALMCATTQGYTHTIKCLLKHGADINAICEHKTALIHAIQHEELEITQVLLANNADPNKGGYIQKPLALARQKNNKILIETLLKYGAKNK